MSIAPQDYPARFVVLYHVGIPEPHYDLMIEARGGQYLHTWRCFQDPLSQYVTSGERIGKHRPLYLTYEGPISGDRGLVTRVHGGSGRVFRTTQRIWVLTFDDASSYLYPGYLFCRHPKKLWLFEGWTPFRGQWLEAELPSHYFR